MVENMLDGIEVRLNVDFLKEREKYEALADRIIYTGAIDAYFDYALGNLEYRSVRFENEVLDIPNFQGNAAVNYTDRETPLLPLPDEIRRETDDRGRKRERTAGGNEPF